MNTTTDDICLLAYSINTSWEFIVSLSVIFMLDFISLGLMFTVFILVLNSKTLHLHLKIFLINLTFSLFIRNFLTAFRAGTILFKNVFTKNDPCAFVANLLTCRRFSEIDKAPIELIVYGIALVSIERFVATYYYKIYEKYTNYLISIIAVIITWIYPIIHLIFVFTDPNIDTILVPYCSSLTSNSINFLTMISVKTPICSICTLLNLLTLWLAERNKRNEPNNGYEHISGRYQLNESIRFTRMITVSNGICHLLVLINVLSLYIIANIKFDNYITFAVAKELSSLTFPVYGNIFALLALAFYFQAKLSRNGFCRKTRIFDKIECETNVVSESYFKYLQNQWN